MPPSHNVYYLGHYPNHGVSGILMLEMLARLFSYITNPLYALTGNWWVTIFLFTLITKVILMPLSLWCQKNSILMVKLMPDLNRIKVRFFGDKEAIGERQTELYKEYHYHPLLSLVPLAVQILILFGLIEVIRSIATSATPGTEFLGMVPLEDGGVSWIMPVLAGLSAWIMGEAQNRIHPLQKEQSKIEKNTTNWLSICLSLFLGVMVSAGMAFYWICSNLLSIIVQLLCNVIIKPSKSIDYAALASTRAELEKLDRLSKSDAGFFEKRKLAAREREDIERFKDVIGKHLVFYSEKNGFYKYFKGVIEWLLAHSDVCIHYVTSDPADQVFELHEREPRLIPYYVDEKRLITLMMKLECNVCVMTLEDLDNFYIKRSYIDQDIEYVFMPHHMTSMFLCGDPHAYAHYETILCAGPHQTRELAHYFDMQDMEQPRLIECGYPLIDDQIAEYDQRTSGRDVGEKGADRPVVLIAPSWQEESILDVCIDEMLDALLGHGYRVIVRPHPEYTKRYRARWEALLERYGQMAEEDLYFEHDFSTSDAIFDSDVLITDWSSIPCEFSFATHRPCIFIDTPMKVGNPDWKAFGMDPTDITLRDQIGRSLSVDELAALPAVIEDMLVHADAWKERILAVREGFIYNLGSGSEMAGAYILDALLKRQDAKEVRAHGEA